MWQSKERPEILKTNSRGRSLRIKKCFEINHLSVRKFEKWEIITQNKVELLS